MDETVFVKKARSAGARVFRVGGCVRDACMGRAPKDRDYLLCGMEEQAFHRLFPEARQVGQSFPVFLLDIGGETCEVSFARRERKSGSGYCGFKVAFSSDVTVEEDLYRRDTTMNSMAWELPEERLIDPYGGQRDVKAGLVRAVSEHFAEDPVRALRAARQSAELDFKITEETFSYMACCKEELLGEPQERIFHEMALSLQTRKPSVFFRNLQRAGLLQAVFPELHALIGQEQPVEFHPEGDAFEHVLLVLDAVSRETSDVSARFAALVHDIGKGRTPKEMLPHHYGHEIAGYDVLLEWSHRMTLPKLWLQKAEFVIKEHMRAPRLAKHRKIAALLMSLSKSKVSVEEFQSIIRADHGSLPEYLLHAKEYIMAMQEVSGAECPSHLHGKEIGDWIFSEQVAAYQRKRKDSGNVNKRCGFDRNF